MKFRLELDAKKIAWPIEHVHSLFLIGSCFTENIGDKFRKYKFTAIDNPHGILFNPSSVTRALKDYITIEKYDDADLFFLNEAWHSWNHHSRYSGIVPGEALNKINESIRFASQALKKSSFVFITLGSAWVYKLTALAPLHTENKIVANNHKAPANWFTRELLSAAEVSNMLLDVIERLQVFNPEMKIIFTISPVRHIREGVIDNNRSKAVLIQAVHDLVAAQDHCYYFPAYELVLDDLRDYRYFSEDLVHPNYFATEYVWEKLVQACIAEKSANLIKEIQHINLAFQHKPFHAGSDQHKKFLQSFLNKTLQLQKEFPYLNFDKEITYFSGGGKSSMHSVAT